MAVEEAATAGVDIPVVAVISADILEGGTAAAIPAADMPTAYGPPATAWAAP